MVEINIYTKYKYRKILKKANIYFNKKYTWYNAKTVFAPYDGDYLVSLRKNNIRICYWNELSNNKTEEFIKTFIKNNFSNQTIGVEYEGKNRFFEDLKSINTIRL